MRIIVISIIILFFAVIALCTGTPGNLDYIKEHAAERWQEMGFEIIGYDGFSWGTWGYGTRYGGARVWYVLKKIPDSGITYGGYLWRWGDEIHMYRLQAYDAIKPR